MRFSEILGIDEAIVNSLHGQGIDKPGDRIILEGFAPDGTPEALLVEKSPGFAMAVQWHPEWNAENDVISRKLFKAFRDSIKM